MDQRTIILAVSVLIVLPLFYFRLRRMMKPQRLKLRTLWLRPALVIFAAGSLLAASPPQFSELVWFALGAGAGAAGGWYWGKLTRLHLHPEDGTLMSSSSQAGMIVLVLLIVFRIGMRAGIGMEAEALHVKATLLADLFIVFAAALFSVQGLEVFIRARQMTKPQA